MPSRGAPPSGCRHLPPQAEEGFQTDALSFPSPAKRGKVPTAGAGAPANSAAGPKGERQDGASQADGGNRG